MRATNDSNAIQRLEQLVHQLITRLHELNPKITDDVEGRLERVADTIDEVIHPTPTREPMKRDAKDNAPKKSDDKK